jgi:hypothetical protein
MKATDVGNLYILLDGTHAASGDCAKGDDGVMRGPSGVPVAMAGEGEPMTVKRQAEEGGAMKAAEMGREAAEAVESGAARPQMVEEKPADERPARNAEAMVVGGDDARSAHGADSSPRVAEKPQDERRLNDLPCA